MADQSSFLPLPLTSFIGRAREVSEVKRLLKDEGGTPSDAGRTGMKDEIHSLSFIPHPSAVRLLTLTGPGGVGKTSLALRAAHELRDAFADGVVFVSLAPISDPTLVLPTIAKSLALKEAPDRLPLDNLKGFLRDKEMLLLLDNFEQVVAAAPQVAELLMACAALKILVTSRAVLRVRGEYEFPLPPLSCPASNVQNPTANIVDMGLRTSDLGRYAAVALFVERACAIKRDFQLTDDNAAAVAAICARLDGLPLAIELAAARIKLLSPQAMLARLEHPMEWLTASARDLPIRQQTLRHTLQWSYDLLTPDEQHLFRSLSVFVGGCALDAIESVCMGVWDTPRRSASPPHSHTPILDLLGSLIDNNLLRQIEQAHGEPRLFMLETIREYAREQLLRSGEAEAIQAAHSACFLALAEQAEPQLTGASQAEWIHRLDRERDNLRAVLQRALAQRDAETAMRLSSALWRFWYAHGYLSEGRRWLEAALDISADSALSLRVKAFSSAGFLVANLGDYARATELCQQALALARELGDKRALASALVSLATTNIWRGPYDQIQALYEESIRLYRELADQHGLSTTTAYLGFMHWFAGNYATAKPLLTEALAQAKQLGNPLGIAFALYGLGFVALNQGEAETSHRYYTESLAIMQQLGDKRGLIRAHTGLGRIALNQGDVATARTHFETA